MTARSHFKRIEVISANAFDTTQPVSAYKAFALRSNVQHLVDSASQYRLNVPLTTATGTSLIVVAGGATTAPAWFHAVFPLTITTSRTIPSFHIRVAASFSGAVTAIAVSASMHPTWSGAPLLSRTVTSTTAGPHWALDEIITLSDTGWSDIVRAHSYRPHPTSQLTSTPNSYMMVRFSASVKITAASSSSGGAGMAAVQVREFV